MKWRENYCRGCKQMTAYAKGGVVGTNDFIMGCDECGTEWEETLIRDDKLELSDRLQLDLPTGEYVIIRKTKRYYHRNKATITNHSKPLLGDNGDP